MDTNSTTNTTPTPTEEPAKALSITNGALKLRHPLPSSSLYRECLKNHAAAMGGHAVDGCGEYMPSLDPTSLLCAACSCHRSFHRRHPTPEPPISDFHSHHRHHTPQPQPLPASPNSPSPPPISSTYYPSAPHMLLALNPNPSPGSGSGPGSGPNPSSGARKRFRTKFTQQQKEKMLELAEKLGWKMQRRDEEAINGFCNGIGVEKGVFKVWMHNNKNTLGKKDAAAVNGTSNGGAGMDLDSHNNHSNEVAVGTNASSASS